MPKHPGRRALALTASLLVLPALALAGDAPVATHRTELLHSYDITDKVDGAEVARHVDVIYDYTDRVARVITHDAAGNVVKSEDVLHNQPHPSKAEVKRAQEILLKDPDLSAHLAQLDYVFEGGFLIEREDGPCGPGTRCVEVQILAAPYRYGLIKKVVIDLVAEKIVVPQYNAELLAQQSIAGGGK
ncbi:MAG: hypothetical protein U0166_07410 [Acidobacteriota bacterium]